MTSQHHLTRQERTAIFTAARRLAGIISRAADYGISSSRLYRELREAIADQEKRHRRFAPVGHRHKFSVEQAVDYFVVRTVAGNVNPDVVNQTAGKLANLRSDYVLATFLMCEQPVRERLSGYLAEVWPDQSADEVLAIVASVDYAALSGSANGLDAETRRGVEWCMTAAHNSPTRKAV